MQRFNKKEYTDARKRIRTFIKKHHRPPNYCAFKNQQGKTIDLNKDEFNGLFEGYMQFCLKHGREPNYLTLNSKAKTSPLVLNLQDDKYSCGPASLQMCMQFLFEYKSEAVVKKALGTGTSGTSPDKLISGARKLGYKVTPIGRELRQVKNALGEYKPVLMHIETGGRTKPSCLNYINNYGHWIMCYKVGDNVYYIADPTKGLKKCKYSVIDKATDGRKISYYSVSLK